MKPKHIYFTNRREYYRRKKISVALKVYWKKKKQEKAKIYFINFEIMEGNGYIQGSLSSSKIIEISTAKDIIKANLPKGYTPNKFYEAEEKGYQRYVLLIVMREDDEIYNEVINV